MNRLLNFLVVWGVMTIAGIIALPLLSMLFSTGLAFPGIVILAMLTALCCAFPFAIDPQYNLWPLRKKAKSDKVES